jgi:hypothetical protein
MGAFNFTRKKVYIMNTGLIIGLLLVLGPGLVASVMVLNAGDPIIDRRRAIEADVLENEE